MRAIRATFDGKTFVPDEPVNLPAQSAVTVLIESDDRAAQAEYDKAIREYYPSAGAEADDDWPEELESDLKKAWDED
jgi:hypothetical protein